MYKNLNSTKNTEKNQIQADLIKSALTNSKNQIKNMSENEKRIEQPEKIVAIIEKILEFNNQDQKGQGLKILPQDQMVSRLPIFLTQLKAGIVQKRLKMK